MKGVSESTPGTGPTAIERAEIIAPAEPQPAGSSSPARERAAPAQPATQPAAVPAPPSEPGQPSQAGQPPRTVVPRWVQLAVLPIALLAVWAIAKAAGKVLLLFIVAAVIALILNPVVALVQRSRLPRGLAVLVVYLAFFLALAGVGALLANPISNQVRTFTDKLPHIVNEANKRLATLQTELDRDGIHLHLVKPGKTALQSIQDKVAKSAGKLASSFSSLLTEVAKVIFDLVLVFVLSVYMLLYGQRIGELVRRVMPRGDGGPEDDYPKLVQRSVSRYVWAQLLFSLIMGSSAALALYLFGVLGLFPPGSEYALAFGAFFGVMELIPYIGPFLGALPPIVVALLTHPIDAVWLTILFIGLQQLEGHIVAPQVFGRTLRTNPLLVIFALLFGLQLYGILGALIALPILSVLRVTVIYLKRHLDFESWERAPRRLL